jgi:hypothetical protein
VCELGFRQKPQSAAKHVRTSSALRNAAQVGAGAGLAILINNEFNALRHKHDLYFYKYGIAELQARHRSPSMICISTSTVLQNCKPGTDPPPYQPLDAKKEETRERGLRDGIALLEQSKGEPDDIPRFVKQALMANAKAWENFRNLAPSYRRHYIGWIMHGKKEETRAAAPRSRRALGAKKNSDLNDRGHPRASRCSRLR